MSMAHPVACLVHVTPGETGYYTDRNSTRVHARGLLIGVDGALDVTWATGRREVIPAGTFATGHIHNVEIRYIWGTNTTAGQILVGLDAR